jgi:MYXO-CTERM domain-containing protein
MAFAPTQVDLSRIMLNGQVFSLTMPLSGPSYPAASGSILSFDTQPVPLPLPQDLPDPGAFWVTFVLSPAPFTMTGHLSAGEIGGPHQIDLDVEGIGFATMKGAYGRLQGIQEPVYWVWETEFTFVPEAPPAALGIVGIAVIALLRRRRGGWARAGRRQPA